MWSKLWMRGAILSETLVTDFLLPIIFFAYFMSINDLSFGPEVFLVPSIRWFLLLGMVFCDNSPYNY